MARELKHNNNSIPDMLVHAAPIFYGNELRGYKWVGFCFGKRFSVIQNLYEKELLIDRDKNTYVFCNESQEMLLPVEFIPLMYGVPLSNRYFLQGKRRDISIEAVLQLIEAGYAMENITMQKYLSAVHGIEDKFLCRYYDKTTNEQLIEITCDGVIQWKVMR